MSKRKPRLSDKTTARLSDELIDELSNLLTGLEMAREACRRFLDVADIYYPEYMSDSLREDVAGAFWALQQYSIIECAVPCTAKRDLLLAFRTGRLEEDAA